MYRIFNIVIRLVLLIILTLFVINYSFIISFEIADYIFSTSSSYIFIALLLFLLIIFVLQTIYFKTKFRYLTFRMTRKLNNKQKGLNAFVSGMISIANKDYKNAIKETKNMNIYLKDDPSLTLLLKSVLSFTVIFLSPIIFLNI